MIELNVEKLYQWEIGVQVSGFTGNAVQFANQGDSQAVTILLEGRDWARIPDRCLTSGKAVKVYDVTVSENSDVTETHSVTIFPVAAKPKPKNYVPTASEEAFGVVKKLTEEAKLAAEESAYDSAAAKNSAETAKDAAKDAQAVIESAEKSLLIPIKPEENHFNWDTITNEGYEITQTGGRKQAVSGTGTSYASELIPVTPGDTIYINNLPLYTKENTFNAFTKRFYCFFDDEKAPILPCSSFGLERTQFSWQVPDGAKYFSFCPYQRVTSDIDRIREESAKIMVTTDAYHDYAEYIGPTLVDVVGGLSSITDVLTKTPGYWDNRYNGSIVNGWEVTTKEWKEAVKSIGDDPVYSVTTGLIPVIPGAVCSVNNLPVYDKSLAHPGNGGKRFYCFFDKDMNAIASLPETGTNAYVGSKTSRFSAYIPQNAIYMVVSLYQRVLDQSTINVADLAVMVSFSGYHAFEPYYVPRIGKSWGVAPTKGMKAVVFGDSITETATMDEDGSNYVEGSDDFRWPLFAMAMLQITDFKNYAKHNATYKDVGTGRENLSHQIALAIADEHNDDADIVVISLGTNDVRNNGVTNDTYDDAMGKDINELDRTKFHQAVRYAMWTIRNKYPKAKCFVATPIQRADREPVLSLRDGIVAMANRYNFRIIDAEYESGITRENEKLFLTDGLHPNVDGAVMMAELYASEILKSFLHAQF